MQIKHDTFLHQSFMQHYDHSEIKYTLWELIFGGCKKKNSLLDNKKVYKDILIVWT